MIDAGEYDGVNKYFNKMQAKGPGSPCAMTKTLSFGVGLVGAAVQSDEEDEAAAGEGNDEGVNEV